MSWSTRLQGLESDLGQRLFDRTSRQVRLSPAGEAALPAARTALTGLASVRQVVDDVAGIRRGRVRLGLVTGADFPLLGDTLASFAAEYPAIEIVIESASASDLEQAVSTGTLDLAVVVHTGQSQLRCHELLRDSLVVVGLPGAANTVPITDLAGHPLIVLDAGAGARTALEAAARRADIALNVAIQVSTPEMARDLHSRRMGTLIIPRSIAPDGGSVLVDAGGDQLSVHVGLVSHPDRRTPVKELVRERIADGASPFIA